jgi:tRNA A-37 threonylcarbamoyl transferase component Bud32
MNEKSRDSTYNKQKSVSVYKKRRNNENKSNIGQNNNNQFLSVINEANDLIKSDSKKGNFRPKLKNNQQENNLLSNKKKYNTKYIKNKLKKLQQSINNINTTNLNLSEKKRSMKNRYNTTYSSNYTNSSINEYEIGSDIGIGSYAEVKLGIHRKTKKKYAIKIYPKNLIDDEDKINSIKNEIYILNQLNHENIMKLYDLINTPKYLYLILEYINGISLLEYIHKSPNKRIEENFCKKIFYQIVKAIEYCTQKNIFHRDIKLENILLINNDSIKIIDFGFAIKCSKKEYQKFFCGTLYYMPPEIINKKKYLPYYSDIWSLGVLLYIMIYGRFPFNSNNEDDLFDLINEGKFEFPEDINSSDDVKNLIKKIIVVEPCKRATLSEIINDTWFKN